MSIFEIVMLLCFGSAWPFSIYTSYTSKKNSGKSIYFLYVVLVGYISGFTHKLFYSFDLVSVLYIVNACMVLLDILIFYRNKRYL